MHQDRGLLQLLGQGVPVIRVAVKRLGAHDQVALELRGAGDAHLHAKLVRLLGLAFADAVHLGCVPGVELGLAIDGLALAALGVEALGLVQRLGERLPNGLPDGMGSLGGLLLDLRCRRPTMVRWRLMARRMRLNWRAWA